MFANHPSAKARSKQRSGYVILSRRSIKMVIPRFGINSAIKSPSFRLFHVTSSQEVTKLPLKCPRPSRSSPDERKTKVFAPKIDGWTISSFPKCSQITVGDVRTTSWKTGTHGSPSESSPALQVPWINNVSCTVDRIYIMIHVITTYFMSSWQVLVMPHNRVITLVHINSSSWCSICRIIVLRAYQHGTTAMYDLSVASMVVRSALLKLHMPLTEYA